MLLLSAEELVWVPAPDEEGESSLPVTAPLAKIRDISRRNGADL